MNIAENIARRCWSSEGIWGDSSCPELLKYTHCYNCKVYAEAGETVLKKFADSSNVAEIFPEISAESQESNENKISYFVFRCAGELFGLKIDAVSGVADVQMVHRIPHRGDSPLAGIVNIGGEIVVCADISRIFGMGDSAKKSGGRLVICGSGADKFAVATDEILGIFPIAKDSVQANRSAHTLAEGFFEIDAGRVSVIDYQLLAHAVTLKHS